MSGDRVSDPLVEPELAQRTLERALLRGGDFAELYCEQRESLTMAIDESRIERVQAGRELGAGVRVVSEGTAYFAHADGIGETDLQRAADGAAEALAGDAREPVALGERVAADPQQIEQRPGEVEAQHKADLLRAADDRARGTGGGGEIAQVQAGYVESRRRVLIANSDGLLASDDRTRVRLSVQAVATREGRSETGLETRGGHRGFELLGDGAAEQVAAEAAKTAITLLDAVPAPAGAMPVVIGGGFGGVLFHEMTGHGLEADHIHKGASVYEGKLGEQVAEPIVTAYDDGRMPGEWGTDGIDDEGTPTQKTAVIEEGKLVAYLHDLDTARRHDAEPTGNGRRQSFRHLPIPRMTNTYIEPGDADPQEIISEVDKGFYAVSFAGGQVDPATGDFVFGVSEGYLIEGGKVTWPCRGATLIGNCLHALGKIDAVGSDFEMRSGICGKGGQQVPVGTGQGHVRISEMTVGGTEVG